MRLYLVQHGESFPEDVDPERPLTDKGRDDVSKSAAFLKGKITPDIIWHSTKLRAKQTAEIFGNALSPENGLREKQNLAPKDPVETIRDEIFDKNTGSLMIVGHLPFMAKLAGLLLAASGSGGLVGFRQGGVVCLESTDQTGWRVAWMIIPDLL
jgi:phosphohistidine phosphatase